VFQKKVREKSKHLKFSNLFFLEILPFMR